MARFYLDEDVPVTLSAILAANGHPSITTVQAGNLHVWDAAQLLYAADNQRILVTHNRGDYRALHEGWVHWSSRWHTQQPHGGILILGKGNQRLTVADYAQAILAFLQMTPVSIENMTFDWFAPPRNEWVQWRP